MCGAMPRPAGVKSAPGRISTMRTLGSKRKSADVLSLLALGATIAGPARDHQRRTGPRTGNHVGPAERLTNLLGRQCPQ
jgi:hypothetical protein